MPSIRRRQLRLLMASGTIFAITFLFWYPSIPKTDMYRLVLLLVLVGVIFSGLILLFLGRGRWIGIVAVMFVSAGVFHNLVSAYLSSVFPSISMPFFPLIVLASHLLLGRWPAFLTFVIMSVAYLPLLEPVNELGLLRFDSSNATYRTNIISNTILSGILILIITEIYDYLRQLFEHQLEQLNREREIDLELAAGIQQDLTPKLTRLGNYCVSGFSRPSAIVSGDYHDAVRVGSVNWFAIGDVSGHGLQAGMLGMQIRSFLSFLLSEQTSTNPAVVLAKLNNAFHRIVKNLKIRSFMTFLLLSVTEDGEVSIAGSQQSLIVIRKNQNRIDIFSPPGILLGLDQIDQDQIAESKLMLDHDDMMVLFTDGLTEAVNKSQEMYSIERLLALIEGQLKSQKQHTVVSMVDAIVSDVDSFRDGAVCNDDLTILCIRRDR